MRVFDRVRVVQMNGCMGHIRHNPREGIVTEINLKKVYGDTSKRRYAKIRLDNGTVIEKCAEPKLWIMHDGLPEYQE